LDATFEPVPPRLGYGRLFLRFLRFGLNAFGGPVAQIAMIRKALVDEERWISSARFNHLLAVMQVLPGPEAHELCVHLGIRAKGRLGGLLAGLGFMLPGLVLMLGVAWAYDRFLAGADLFQAAFLGVQAAVLALIARAVRHIGGHVLNDRLLWALGVGAAFAALAGVGFWIVLAACGGIYALTQSGRRAAAWLALIAAAGVAAAVHMAGWGELQVAEPAVVGGSAAWPALLLAGLKAGLLTFGGAYTAIPFVRADTVGRGWIDDGRFLDGVAFAGVLPAPLIIFCTFVGYLAGGWAGALAITAGVFLPAFAFSMVLYERLERIVEDARLQRLLTGVAAGAVGLIAATFIQLGRTTVGRVPSLLEALAVFAAALTLVVLWKNRMAGPTVIAGGALAGHLLWG
jgi:chromate transporter